jgi:hypothetical protein
VPRVQADLQAGKFVVVVHGMPQELETVRRIMSENGGQDVVNLFGQRCRLARRRLDRA